MGRRNRKVGKLDDDKQIAPEFAVQKTLKMRHRRWWKRRLLRLGCLGIVALSIVLAVLLVTSTVMTKVAEQQNVCQPDEEAPVITINGDEIITLVAGRGEYTELGATAIDACGEVAVEMEGEVDVNTAGVYRVFYSATDNFGNAAKVRRKINVLEYHGTIYLTFDDGPGDYTAMLLDVLAKYNIKATFFVTNNGDDAIIAREYDEGHAIGLHTASHNYAYIYASVDNFWADLIAVQERVARITGYTSKLMRFPGGSSNLVSRNYDGGKHIMSALTALMDERGFNYFDWNVDSKDAGGATTADEVYNNVISALKIGGESVVLQHDVKSFSVEAVERIVQYGIDNGFIFEKLTADSFNAHHGVNN
ncbi:polysaccharide deacetylase family protein [Candidatus Saccharibacteria bacterium]|nr:polysaccharide deacetylase family protein [Candidatus Saccharibacteria bacterium]